MNAPIVVLVGAAIYFLIYINIEIRNTREIPFISMGTIQNLTNFIHIFKLPCYHSLSTHKCLSLN